MAVENKPTTSNDEEQAKTALFLVVIAIFGFWYWYCSDGIRAVKNMHVYEIISEDQVNFAGLMGVNFSKGALKNRGMGVDITFEEAIDRTSPKNVEFDSFASEISAFGQREKFKGVQISILYDPPLANKYKTIDITYAVLKEHFYHFNPAPIGPIAITYMTTDGHTKQISGGRQDVLLPIAAFFSECPSEEFAKIRK